MDKNKGSNIFKKKKVTKSLPRLVIKFENWLFRIKGCCIKEHSIYKISNYRTKIINISYVEILMIMHDYLI